MFVDKYNFKNAVALANAVAVFEVSPNVVTWIAGSQLKLHLPCLLSYKIELESGCQLSVANSQEYVRWHLAAV